MVDKKIELDTGIPADSHQRELYAVEMLYRFDLCVCRLSERALEYFDCGMTIDGFADEIERTPALQQEIKSCFHEWILENGEWVM